jgi:hypothetical protein
MNRFFVFNDKGCKLQLKKETEYFRMIFRQMKPNGMKRKKCGETDRGQSKFRKRMKVERNKKRGMRTRKIRRLGYKHF